ncbi:MAG: hypothetical protein R2703_15405 [Micropruina glycogenica]
MRWRLIHGFGAHRGVTLHQTDDGQLFFKDGQDRAGQTSTLTAWDGRLDTFGDPIEVVPVDANLEQTASKGERTDQDLTLTTPQNWSRILTWCIRSSSTLM